MNTLETIVQFFTFEGPHVEHDVDMSSGRICTAF